MAVRKCYRRRRTFDCRKFRKTTLKLSVQRQEVANMKRKYRKKGKSSPGCLAHAVSIFLNVLIVVDKGVQTVFFFVLIVVVLLVFSYLSCLVV